MKVNGFRELFLVNRTLKSNAEGGDGHGGPGYDQNQQHSGKNGDSPDQPAAEVLQLNAEQQKQAVEKAVEEFQKEAQTQQHGLQASISPGLRVVLSDVNGNVIRQFEATEFVRMRQSGSGDGRGRGKLLDQKF